MLLDHRFTMSGPSIPLFMLVSPFFDRVQKLRDRTAAAALRSIRPCWRSFFPSPRLARRHFAKSRLAQLVERKTLNLVVVGSSPTVGGLPGRGIGAIGSVRASQARGTGIETQILQHGHVFVVSFIFFFFFFVKKK